MFRLRDVTEAYFSVRRSIILLGKTFKEKNVKLGEMGGGGRGGESGSVMNV